MVRNILALVAGLVAGSIVNMGIVTIGFAVIPLADPTYESPLETKNLIFPFAAHALGTLAGAAVASLIALSYRLWISLAIGALFLMGGIAAVSMIVAPLWFEAVDLIVAYIPMAWLGWKLTGGKR